MYKIVLTGGPCSGKSSILTHLIKRLGELGYKVITVPESATELILNGIAPSNEINMLNFQNFVLDLQIMQEDVFYMSSNYYDSAYDNKTIMFCDRGIMDGCAYVEKNEFEKLLNERNMQIEDVYNRYDAVFHLVTAADGAEEFYQWNDPNKKGPCNNAARRETPEEARKIDKKSLECWRGHSHLRVFDNSTNFEGKINRVIEETLLLIKK